MNLHACPLFNKFGTTNSSHTIHTDSPILAEGSIPILPVSMDASSDSMSPKMLFVTIVSNCKKYKLYLLIDD
jgi:hypothetical protein